MKILESEVKDRLSYDPISGIIIWKTNYFKNRIGKEAGTKFNSGYKGIYLGGKLHRYHKLAWFLYYGKWHENELDHINRIKTDNRIENLREVTRRGNSQNRCSFKNGVSLDRNKWRARIMVDGKNKSLGHFHSREEAEKTYLEAVIKYGS